MDIRVEKNKFKKAAYVHTKKENAIILGKYLPRIRVRLVNQTCMSAEDNAVLKSPKKYPH